MPLRYGELGFTYALDRQEVTAGLEKESFRLVDVAA